MSPLHTFDPSFAPRHTWHAMSAGSQVVIVDEDQQHTTSLSTALERLGFEVSVRKDAPIGLLRDLRPRAIVINNELSDSTGFAICTRIRRDASLKRMPVVITSGAKDMDEAFRKHQKSAQHADAYWLKPIEHESLAQKLKELVERAPPPLPRTSSSESNNSSDLGPPPLANHIGERESTDQVDVLRNASDDLYLLAKSPRELWPIQNLEDVLETEGNDPEPLKRTATTEQRLEQLRHRLKIYEGMHRQLPDTWRQIQEKGAHPRNAFPQLAGQTRNPGGAAL